MICLKKVFCQSQEIFSNIFEFGNEYAILKNDGLTSCLPYDEDEEDFLCKEGFYLLNLHLINNLILKYIYSYNN